MTAPDLLAALAPVLRVLSDLGVRHFVGGSIASSAEDIVLAKLDWYRRGGEVSERQWTDVLGVLQSSAGRLDLPFLQRGSTELGIGDLLKRALDEADPRSALLHRHPGSPSRWFTESHSGMSPWRAQDSRAARTAAPRRASPTPRARLPG